MAIVTLDHIKRNTDDIITRVTCAMEHEYDCSHYTTEESDSAVYPIFEYYDFLDDKYRSYRYEIKKSRIDHPLPTHKLQAIAQEIIEMIEL